MRPCCRALCDERDEILPYFANLEPCLIGMEACGSAHHWARKLAALEKTKQWYTGGKSSQRLAGIPGIGPLAASALVSGIGDTKNFGSGRFLPFKAHVKTTQMQI